MRQEAVAGRINRSSQEVGRIELAPNVTRLDFTGRGVRLKVMGPQGYSPTVESPLEFASRPTPTLAPEVETTRRLKRKFSPPGHPHTGRRKKEQKKGKKDPGEGFNPNERRRSGCRCPDPHDKAAPPCKSQWCPKKRGEHRLGANRALNAALTKRDVRKSNVAWIRRESRVPTTPVANRSRR